MRRRFVDRTQAAEARRALASWLKQRKSRTLDIGGLSSLDTPGALFLCGLRERHVELAGNFKEASRDVKETTKKLKENPSLLLRRPKEPPAPERK